VLLSSVLLRTIVDKVISCQDMTLCVLVLPVRILALHSPHWHKLLAASVLPKSMDLVGFIRVRHSRFELLHGSPFAPRKLAMWNLNFGRLAPRTGFPCPGVIPWRSVSCCCVFAIQVPAAVKRSGAAERSPASWYQRSIAGRIWRRPGSCY
jgi:hypothetical protein